MNSRKYTLFVALLLIMVVTACHSPEPRAERGDSSDLPGLKVPMPDEDSDSDDRPSVSDGDKSLREELTDAGMRFSQGEMCLRMNRGGVLFTSKTDGTWCVYDLDGASQIEANPTRGTLVIDGRSVTVTGVTLLREYGGVKWYEFVADKRALLVVESL